MPILGGRQIGVRGLGFTTAGKPNQVTGLTATDFGTSRAFNNGRIDLSWTAPANNGAPITGYRIERSTDNVSYSAISVNTGTTATSYSDTGLNSNQIYYYKVAAINAVDTGPLSTAANATSTTVPQAPTVSAANVGTGRAYNNGAATVTVSGGATGGKAISSYTATSSPGSFTATSGSPLTVTGLQSATAYTFSVTATNANGTSTATVSNSITATTVPQAPTIGAATDGGTGTTVSVAFTGNATGGSAITGYTATSSPGGLTGTGASSPITVSGLTTGTAYTFTVTATNANGTSTASAASNSVTPILPAAFESIATFTSSTLSEVTFSSIPQTYKNLHIRYAITSSGGGTSDLTMSLNGDTTLNFNSLRTDGTTITAQLFNGNNININQPPGVLCVGTIDLIDYASTTKNKAIKSFNGYSRNTTNTNQLNLISLRRQNTAAVSSITLRVNGNNFSGSIALYGIKG
jgi:hypothetical protein